MKFYSHDWFIHVYHLFVKNNKGEGRRRGLKERGNQRLLILFISGPRRLLTICFNYGAYSSQYDMCHLTGCGFRSLESYTGYSSFHIDHNAPRLIKKNWQNHRHNEICKADRMTWKLSLQDVNTTPKEPQGEVVAVDSCFDIIVARQDSASTEKTEALLRKYPLTLF